MCERAFPFLINRTYRCAQYFFFESPPILSSPDKFIVFFFRAFYLLARPLGMTIPPSHPFINRRFFTLSSVTASTLSASYPFPLVLISLSLHFFTHTFSHQLVHFTSWPINTVAPKLPGQEPVRPENHVHLTR